MNWERPSPWTCFWLKLEAEGWTLMRLSTQIQVCTSTVTVCHDSVDWMTWNSGLEHWTRLLEWSLTSAAADLSGWIFSWSCGLTVATRISYCRTSVTFMHFRGDTKLSVQHREFFNMWSCASMGSSNQDQVALLAAVTTVLKILLLKCY